MKKYELYPVTRDRCVMHMAVCFMTGLSNGSIQEKFDGRVVGECLFSLCSFFFPTHSFGFLSFPPENTAVIIAEMKREFCLAPIFVFKPEKITSAWSLSQPVQLLVFTGDIKLHIGC